MFLPKNRRPKQDNRYSLMMNAYHNADSQNGYKFIILLPFTNDWCNGKE